MRKITTRTEEQKKARRNQLTIGLILVAVMLFSVLGYSFGSNPETSETKVDYNGFEFIQQSGLWYLNMGDVQFSFLHTPKETFNINSTINLLNSYLNKPLYIYSENAESESEIARNLFYNVRIAQRIQRACPEGMNCTNDFPTKTCSDNFIIIKDSNDTQIRQEENCVFIEGNNAILTRLTDGFLFKVLGIQ